MSKISKEELKELQEQEQKKSAIKHDLGLLETQKHSLLHFENTRHPNSPPSRQRSTTV